METTTGNTNPELKGVRGWLLVLCISTTIIFLLFTFAKSHEMSEAWMWLLPGVIAFSITSGVFLWNGIPVGVVLVRTLLIIILVLQNVAVLTLTEDSSMKCQRDFLQRYQEKHGVHDPSFDYLAEFVKIAAMTE